MSYSPEAANSSESAKSVAGVGRRPAKSLLARRMRSWRASPWRSRWRSAWARRRTSEAGACSTSAASGSVRASSSVQRFCSARARLARWMRRRRRGCGASSGAAPGLRSARAFSSECRLQARASSTEVPSGASPAPPGTESSAFPTARRNAWPQVTSWASAGHTSGRRVPSGASRGSSGSPSLKAGKSLGRVSRKADTGSSKSSARVSGSRCQAWSRRSSDSVIRSSAAALRMAVYQGSLRRVPVLVSRTISFSARSSWSVTALAVADSRWRASVSSPSSIAAS